MRSPWSGENEQPHETPAPRSAPADPFPRRRTDRVERATGVLVAAGALLAVVLAVLTSVSLHGSGVRQAANDAVDRVAVTATLTAPVEASPGLDATMSPGVGAAVPATWTAPDGSLQTGTVPVMGPQPAGSSVPIWVDRTGALAPPPVTATQAAVTSVVGGLLVLLAGGLLLAGVRAGVRARCAALNHRAWAREWAEVGPRWAAGAGF
ncbi:hypothetical protein [Pseudonocardia sp. WMMC193]|uniref:Rv1733c family protein n=1 Tax=Pseudonocardia sp. WMMC193 TaxID=2911965 RepID=UPI001F22DABA|nr:hypothetical protein [Pseudonocardia sp. WMMC193]MCF7549169.1 hypothetical protein [Pseudonocardia sp. WMMC193]